MKRKTKTLLKAIAVLLAAGGVSGFLTKNSMHVHDTIHRNCLLLIHYMIFFVNFAHTGK